MIQCSVGNAAGLAVTTGVKNILIGGLAGDAITDADGNIAIGHSAMSSRYCRKLQCCTRF